MDLERYAGLIFDMDGTLIDTMPFHLDAWQKTAEKFGFPFERCWMNSLGGMPSPKITLEINKRFGLELDPSEVAPFKMATFEKLANKGSNIDLTCDIVRAYYGKKPMGVGTGSQRVTAIPLLKERELFGYFDSVVTASEVTNHKPHPDTFLAVAREINVNPTQCVVFEDTELGKLAAHAAGMDCIMVQEGGLVFYPVITKDPQRSLRAIR